MQQEAATGIDEVNAMLAKDLATQKVLQLAVRWPGSRVIPSMCLLTC